MPRSPEYLRVIPRSGWEFGCVRTTSGPQQRPLGAFSHRSKSASRRNCWHTRTRARPRYITIAREEFRRAVNFPRRSQSFGEMHRGSQPTFLSAIRRYGTQT